MKLTLLPLAALVAVLSGCGSGSGKAPDDAKPTAPAFSAFTFDASRLNAAPDLSAFQRSILEDGVLTFPEYEQATLAFLSCVEDGGVIVRHVEADQYKEGPELTSRGQYRFSLYLPNREGKPAAVDEMRGLENRCGTEFTAVIQQLWAEHIAPSEKELAAAREALAVCLREQGLDIPEPPSSEDFGVAASSPAYATCSSAVALQFAIPGFGG